MFSVTPVTTQETPAVALTARSIALQKPLVKLASAAKLSAVKLAYGADTLTRIAAVPLTVAAAGGDPQHHCSIAASVPCSYSHWPIISDGHRPVAIGGQQTSQEWNQLLLSSTIQQLTSEAFPVPLATLVFVLVLLLLTDVLLDVVLLLTEVLLDVVLLLTLVLLLVLVLLTLVLLVVEVLL